MTSTFRKMKKKWNCFFRNLNDPPVIVLLYHRIADLADDPFLLAVSPDNFRKQIHFLSAHFPILRFEDSWQDVQKTSFVITFDDGYRDNFVNALPILEKFRVPATFFITSENVRTRRNFWWDELAFLMKDRKSDTFFELQENLKKYDAERRESYLKDLFHSCGKKTADFPCQVISESELVNFATSEFVTIGSHTKNHCQLSSLCNGDQQDEIQGGIQTLADILGRSPEVFSYPFGTQKDYNSDSVNICRELNLKKVASNYSHAWHPGDSDFEIPRTLVRNWSLLHFQYELFKSLIR